MIAFKSKLPIDLSILGHYCCTSAKKSKTLQKSNTDFVHSCFYAASSKINHRSPSTLCLADTVLNILPEDISSQFPPPWTSGPEEFEFFACDGNISLFPWGRTAVSTHLRQPNTNTSTTSQHTLPRGTL